MPFPLSCPVPFGRRREASGGHGDTRIGRVFTDKKVGIRPRLVCGRRFMSLIVLMCLRKKCFLPSEASGTDCPGRGASVTPRLYLSHGGSPLSFLYFRRRPCRVGGRVRISPQEACMGRFWNDVLVIKIVTRSRPTTINKRVRSTSRRLGFQPDQTGSGWKPNLDLWDRPTKFG